MKRTAKDDDIAKKMYAIAEMVGDLNKAGKVKSGAQNDFGYATIKKVVVGCNIRAHHMLDNTLSFDLLISPTADEKYETKCKITKTKFKELFPDSTNENANFIIPSRENEPHYRLWVDVTEIAEEDLSTMIEKIRRKIA
jgi:hypothetical protein